MSRILARPFSNPNARMSRTLVASLRNAGSQCSVFARFTRSMEAIQSKTADHTISYILHYLKSVGVVPSWVARLHVFLDNAGSTNKNQYLMSSCMELVQHRVLQYLRISFMIPGHTKFAPDLLFSHIAKSYYKSDVFNETDLQLIVGNFGSTCHD